MCGCTGAENGLQARVLMRPVLQFSALALSPFFFFLGMGIIFQSFAAGAATSAICRGETRGGSSCHILFLVQDGNHDKTDAQRNMTAREWNRTLLPTLQEWYPMFG